MYGKLLVHVSLAVLVLGNVRAVMEPTWLDYELAGLVAHNKYRAQHSAPAMKLDRKMCDSARAYAEKLFSLGSLKHSTPSERDGAGENLAFFATASTGSQVTAPQRVTEMVHDWYNGGVNYNYNSGQFQSGTGHFTQVVWKSSKLLGIGYFTGVSRGLTFSYVVARYSPAGNMLGKFHENVLPPSTGD